MNRRCIRERRRVSVLLSVLLILCVVMSFALASQINIMADAVTKVFPSNNTGVISIAELLSGNRGDSATSVGDKSIFDFESLTSLFNALTGKTNATLKDVEDEMAKTQYNNGKAVDGTYTPNTSSTDYSNAFVGSIHYGMNSEDIRSVTSGNNIEVMFGGQIWSVVALTTTGTTTDVSAGDVVLTLLLKDPISGYKTKWNDYQTQINTNHNEKYTSSFYSASKIRSILLNGKDVNGNDVKYTTNGSTLSTLTSGGIPNYATDWAKFTDSTAAKNVKNFLVKPKDVLYTQDENFYDIRQAAGANTNYGSGQNEASLNKIPSKFGGTGDKWHASINVHYQQEKSVYGTAVQGSNQTYSAGDQLYFDWGNDLLWLPSWAEVGEHGTNSSNAAANDSITGLWALNTNQRAFSNASTSAGDRKSVV